MYLRDSSSLGADVVVVRIQKRTNRVTFGHEERRSCDVTRAMTTLAIQFCSQSSAADNEHAQSSLCSALFPSINFPEVREAN